MKSNDVNSSSKENVEGCSKHAPLSKRNKLARTLLSHFKTK